MSNQVLTPRTPTGERLSFPLTSVTFLKGKMKRWQRWTAVVEIDGKQYRLRSAACNIPRCGCDAVITEMPERKAVA